MMYGLMACLFVLGYLAIAFEHPLKLDKTASALLLGVLLWIALFLGGNQLQHVVHEWMTTTGTLNASAATAPTQLTAFLTTELRHHLSEIAEILFFLLGAMTIVELIDAHGGFNIITRYIKTSSPVKLIWIIGLFTFFLSAILDNLTTTIVMISLLRKLITVQRERWLTVGLIVIAANAGGAWSPMGDVTTTMLWIGHQITAASIITKLFLPSLICILIPLIMLSWMLKDAPAIPVLEHSEDSQQITLNNKDSAIILSLGLGSLLLVPVFKTVTHLPPYMGILFGLGVLWVATAILHHHKEDDHKTQLSVAQAMSRIDTPSVLFFLGILLAVSALATAGHLTAVADYLKQTLGNVPLIGIAIGLLSAIVDNVPLVAGAMKMYPVVSPEQLAMATGPEALWLSHFVQDGLFWELLAFCAGTGGSCLIIGSAAGVVAMGMEKIDFMWYFKRISLLALSGYLAGAAFYIFVSHLF